ncbi:MAG: DUF4160 domain-containing protein [Vulcanimicrobiaceae bacterium]
MPGIVEVNGYAVRLFTRDHGNPHVHVFHDGTLMKIWISPQVVFASHSGRKPRKAEITTAERIVADHHAACLREWKRMYG